MARQQRHKESTKAKNERRAGPKNKTSNYNSLNSKAKLNRKEKLLIMLYKEISTFQLFDTFTPCILCIELAALFSCGASLF
jgi:hypothetical protein